jgi:hypothetical protein
LFILPIDKLLKLWYNRNSVRLGRGRTAKKAPRSPYLPKQGAWGKIQFKNGCSGSHPLDPSHLHTSNKFNRGENTAEPSIIGGSSLYKFNKFGYVGSHP